MPLFTTPISHTLKQGNGAGSVTTDAIDTTGADLLILVLADFSGGDLGTISDNKSNSWTALTSYFVAGQPRSTIFYSKPTSVGTGHTFASTGGAVNDFPSLAVSAWANSASSSVFDQQNGNSSSSASTLSTGSVTPTQNNELLIAVLSSNQPGGTRTIDGGFTVMDDAPVSGAPAEGLAHAYLVQTSAAAANPAWTFPSGGAGIAIATFKAASYNPNDLAWKPVYPTTLVDNTFDTVDSGFTPRTPADPSDPTPT